ncbi:Gfo/Idh/MocA family protein [Manganibacter manganicus]|uniref:Oxidoreductase n=1 Tax=Manganibacter manganicus TaxID=1873176 RepID=A0A1V8RWE6_9HYPH|nr:Gfo/Idh/MocA family oxidoreductase [Pseudaminobacter manganicus]OQM77475.1 oxidoreductase [Pseudaminobacter manganicus]
MAGIAFVGTGFVADYYMTTLANHPELRLAGVFDENPEATARFSTFHKVRRYSSMEELLGDPAVAIVVNLTNPESHYAISRLALEAEKHVYSEKPLAMNLDEAEGLVKLAAERCLCLAAAPANGLSEAHTAVAAALADIAIGQVRLVYAEMEDGPVFRQNWRTWRSRSGASWPGRHEFEIGCTLEHAGYALSWLVSLFGPVESLSAFSALTFPDKGIGNTASLGPDFSVGCLNFRSGPVARLTCGLAAPKSRSLTILGDAGSIVVRDLWDHNSPVHMERVGEPRSLLTKVLGRVEHSLGTTLPFNLPRGRRLRLGETSSLRLPGFPSQIDFCAGIAAMAEAVEQGSKPFFSGDVALHITEIALALSDAGGRGGSYRPRSGFNRTFAPAGSAPLR